MLLRRVVANALLAAKSMQFTRWHRTVQNARELQREKLHEKLSRIAGSRFARDHGLSPKMNVDEFRRAIPVAGYPRMAPYIASVMHGDVTELFAPRTEIVMFAVTSGTTGPSKYIPVTRAQVAEYRRSWGMWSVAIARENPSMIMGKILILASSWKSENAPSGVPCGSITGKLSSILFGLMRELYILHPELARYTPTRSRYYLYLRMALARRDVVMINCANPTTLIQLGRWCNEWQDDLIRDIHDGTLSRCDDLPADLRRLAGSLLTKRDPKRAKELEVVSRASAGRLLPRHAWPELARLGVWTGGTTAPFLAQLPHWYGPVPLRDHGLSASEGRMTIPLVDGTSSGVLDVSTHFFEFLPESEIGRKNPETLLAHELEVGRDYGIVLTTSGGLVRYDMQDIVRVDGFLGEAPLLRFLNKGRDIANITGEKLTAFQVAEAARRVQAALEIDLGEFALQPVFADPPYYRLLMEHSNLRAVRAPDVLAKAFDTELSHSNIEYRDKQKGERLGPIRIAEVPDQYFRELRDQRIRTQGTAFEQYKHPCLITDVHMTGEDAGFASA